MAVKIRLARIGKKNAPFHRIVAIDSRAKRDGAYLDNLGTFDPLKGTIVTFNAQGIEEWVSKGAIMTDSVKKIQRMFKKQTA